MNIREVCYESGCIFQPNAIGIDDRIAITACGQCDTCKKFEISEPSPGVKWPIVIDEGFQNSFIRRYATDEESSIVDKYWKSKNS